MSVCAWSSIYLHACLLHCRSSVPTGRGTASWWERLISWRAQTSRNALCLTKHSNSALPSEIINRDYKWVMMEVTAPIGKLFLLTLHFFCLCFCLSQYFVLIIWSGTALVHTVMEMFLVAILFCFNNCIEYASRSVPASFNFMVENFKIRLDIPKQAKEITIMVIFFNI